MKNFQAKKSLTIEKLLSNGFDDPNIKKRFIRISGKAEIVDQEKQRVSVYLQRIRQEVEQDQKGNWHCSLKGFNPHRSLSLQILNSSNKIDVNLPTYLQYHFQSMIKEMCFLHILNIMIIIKIFSVKFFQMNQIGIKPSRRVAHR